MKRWNPNIVCLQETKMEKMDNKVIRRVGGSRWKDLEHLGAIRAAGGILLMWDKRVFSRVGVEIGVRSRSCLLKMTENDQNWVLLGVYGPCLDFQEGSYGMN